MPVGRAQCLYVLLAGLPGIDKVGTTPAEARLPDVNKQQIGGQARVPAIAVGEGMNLYQTVKKANRDFIRTVAFIVDPEPAIIEELAQFDRNPVGIYAYVAGCPSELAGPAPYPTEHAPVQLR
jgi:hypothetical protein